MKQLLTALIILVSLNALSQKASRWFLSVASGPSFGGPMPSIRHQIEKQNFNQMSQGNFLGLEWSTQYPKVTRGGTFLVKAGKNISAYKSVFVSGGLSAAGEARGFRSSGTYSTFLFFGGTDGAWVDIDYRVLQFAAGYQYAFQRTRAKLAVAPAAYVLRYAISDVYSEKLDQTSIVPGVSGSLRMPLGKEKKLVGFDLLIEADLAPPAKMKNKNAETTSFKPGSVNMIHALIGLALSFRR
ncbi:MAG TPA: hypothetical protein VNR87_01090 [Flavisolibacter sp.]|nr:hypothetical protein [Flavisolibacter sp.]